MPNYRRLTWEVVALAGLLVGTLDILAAYTQFYISTGKNPIPAVSKYIASGVFGRDALKGGADMIILGIVFHYIIAFLFTIFFFWIYKRWPLLSRNWVLTGFACGIFIWVVMTQVVVKLSNTLKMGSGTIGKKIIAALILITMIGLPLSYIAKRLTKNQLGQGTPKA